MKTILPRRAKHKRPKKKKKTAQKSTPSTPSLPRRRSVNVIDGDDGSDDYAAPPQKMQPRFRFLSASQVRAEPKPSFLVEGLLLVGALFSIFGAPEVGKSLLALWLMVCVVTQRPFADRAVNLTEPRSAILIVTEGGAFVGSRLRAIQKAHGITDDELKHLYILKGPVALTDRGEVLDFIRDLRAFLRDKPPAALIIFDTLTRCLGRGGADENSAKDTALLADCIDRIAAETGAAVGVIDHTGKREGNHARGHSNKHGNVDTEVLVTRDKKRNLIKLTSAKANHADAFKDICLMVEKHADATAVVPFRERVVMSAAGRAEQTRRHLIDHDLQALRALIGEAEGLSFSHWLRKSGVVRATFDRARGRLLKDRLIRSEGPTTRPRYLLTDEGQRVAEHQEAEA